MKKVVFISCLILLLAGCVLFWMREKETKLDLKTLPTADDIIKSGEQSITSVAPIQSPAQVEYRTRAIISNSTVYIESSMENHKVILPKDLDFPPNQPPQWTKTIAKPNPKPIPPDPNVAPPIVVNPERVPANQ
jgi:hypothetical protein